MAKKVTGRLIAQRLRTSTTSEKNLQGMVSRFMVVSTTCFSTVPIYISSWPGKHSWHYICQGDSTASKEGPPIGQAVHTTMVNGARDTSPTVICHLFFPKFLMCRCKERKQTAQTSCQPSMQGSSTTDGWQEAQVHSFCCTWLQRLACKGPCMRAASNAWLQHVSCAGYRQGQNH